MVVYTVVGFFVIPPIARSQLEKRLSAQLGRRVTAEKLRLNPYTLSVTLENFAVQEKDNSATFLGWRRLYLNVDPLLSWKEWVVKEVNLEGFETRVAVNPDQSLNVSDILAKLAPPTADTPPAKPVQPPRPVRVRSVRVADARIDFSDHSRTKPFATRVGPLTFALSEFRTVSEVGAPYRFEAVTESGERFAWAGTLQAEPPASKGELTIENIVLAKYAPYYADRFQGDLVEGKLSVRGRYDVSLGDGKRSALLQEGAVQIRGLKLLERSTQESALELPSLDISGVQVDATTQKLTVASIAVAGGHVRARREKDGSINLIKMLQPPGGNAAQSAPPAATPAAAPSATPPTKPDVTVGEFAVKDFRVEIVDQAAARASQLALNDVQLSLRNVTLAEGAQMPLQAAFNWAPNGAVRIDGSVALTPIKADLTVDLASLDLLPLSPYLEQFANARLAQGAITAGLIVEATLPADQPPVATVLGAVKLEKFGLVDAARNEELAGFAELTLSGLRASTAPELSVTLDEINLSAPFARIVVNSDKSLNLASLAAPAAAANAPAPTKESTPALNASAEKSAPAEPSQPATVATAAAAAPLPKIEIRQITIRDGDFRFSDRSLQPNVNLAINHFGGTIAGLSSTNPAKADLDLKAMVDGAGPIALAGKIDPLGATRSFDVKVDFKNVDLVPLSAYSGKFAGYELARGKLLLDVKANVVGNKIDASNVITLNQFTFGSPVKSPDATSLPVRLGVALLKDTDGKIVIDVPVQGSTDDPSFRVGRVVLRVVVNLLTKAAVSPFAMLGAAFGGGGDELAFQEFAPGSSQLRPEEMKKLETMVKALTNRPGLSVNLQGSYDAAADPYAVKRAKLDEAVRRAVWEHKRAASPNIPPPAQLTITAEEEAAMIKKMFDDQFPPGTRFGAPVPPPPEMAPPPAPPAGAFARFLASITGQADREAKTIQQENARRVAEHAKAIEAAVATGLPLEDMRGRLAEATPVDKNDLRQLAQARAESVREYFATTGKISPDRLFLSKDRADSAAETKGARVLLELQ
jgi:hypothetical protein